MEPRVGVWCNGCEMRRIATIFLLLGVAYATAAAGGAQVVSRPPLVGLTGTSVVRVDPVTLSPIGRSAAIPFYWGSAALSSDGAQLAVGSNNSGTLRFFDLRGMRSLGDVKLATWADGLAWLGPRLLVARLSLATGTRFVAVDTAKRRIRWQVWIARDTYGVQTWGPRLVALTAPTDHIGTAGLMEIDSSGHVQSIALDPVRAGLDAPADPTTAAAEELMPGLAVDPVGGQAYVVGDGQPVVQVDLRTLAVTSHGGTRTLAKVENGWSRTATWLGNGTLAVTGINAQGSVAADGTETGDFEPSGLELVDTRNWTVRVVDPSASWIAASGDRLLTAGWGWSSSGGSTGHGLSLYGLDGQSAGHLFGSSQVSVTTADGLAYVWFGLPSENVSVVDPATGAVLETRSTKLLELLAPTG